MEYKKLYGQDKPLWPGSYSSPISKKRFTVVLGLLFILVVLGLSTISHEEADRFSKNFSGSSSSSSDRKWKSTSSNTFPKSPLASPISRLPHPKARDVKVHFLNHHFGTSSEMKAVAKAVSLRNNVKIEVKETWGIYEIARSLHIPKALSNKYWPKAQEVECNPTKYDIIVSADTMPLIRPHLQNCCPMKLVSLLTTRYDWAHFEEMEWRYLVANASRWNNFRIHPNNLVEKWYSDWKGADIKMSKYLPSSGVPSSDWSRALQTVNFTTSQPDDDRLIVPTSVRTEECLTNILTNMSISYVPYQRNKYGGPLGLTDRVVVHFPYQSNTMSLFENLHQRVIYVLPTLRLFREMGTKCQARMEKIPNAELTDKDFYEKVDWWREDLQHLFFYFDDFADLRQGSSLRRQIALEADEKRVAIGDFMLKQKERVLSDWEDMLFEDWYEKGTAVPQCEIYKEKYNG